MIETKKYKIIFLCTANSCRSQMAEGLARHYGKEIIEPYSAGLFSYYVHPRAIEVMKETGINISNQQSKAIDVELLKSMDLIITLCGYAEAVCHINPTDIKRIHWPINDPVGTVGTEEEILNAFRRTRDKIKSNIQNLIEDLKSQVKI